MTAAEIARIVEAVLTEAGLVVYIDRLGSDTTTCRYNGRSIELAGPTKTEIGVAVVGVKPGGSWENHIRSTGADSPR